MRKILQRYPSEITNYHMVVLGLDTDTKYPIDKETSDLLIAQHLAKQAKENKTDLLYTGLLTITIGFIAGKYSKSL